MITGNSFLNHPKHLPPSSPTSPAPDTPPPPPIHAHARRKAEITEDVPRCSRTHSIVDIISHTGSNNTRTHASVCACRGVRMCERGCVYVCGCVSGASQKRPHTHKQKQTKQQLDLICKGLCTLHRVWTGQQDNQTIKYIYSIYIQPIIYCNYYVYK